MSIRKLFFTGIICLLSKNIFCQQSIPFTWNRKCDSSLISSKIIKAELGNIQCIEDPNNDQIIYFTKKIDFQNYTHKNKRSKGYCNDKPEMIFDFDKYDVVIIRISMAGCGLPKYIYKVGESQVNYVIFLNFYFEEVICADKNIFFRYVLLPKGKITAPEFCIFKIYK